MQADPDAFLTRCVNASNELRKAFGSSSYVPLAALMMVQRIGDEQFAETASQARKIYDLMKAKHFFLTGDDDSPSCVALALSGKDPEALINDSEQCYEILKQNHFSRNAIQSLSNTLAGYDGTPAEKCARAVELSQLLRKNGFDGDPSQFLSGIGVLAMTNRNGTSVAAEMAEAVPTLAEVPPNSRMQMDCSVPSADALSRMKKENVSRRIYLRLDSRILSACLPLRRLVSAFRSAREGRGPLERSVRAASAARPKNPALIRNLAPVPKRIVIIPSSCADSA